MDQNIYLRKLSEFSTMLRAEGIAAGLQETADASVLLADTDLSDRETTKMALRSVFAKSRDEAAAFDRCFDNFFVSEEQRRALMQKALEEQQELNARRRQAEEELQFNGKPIDIPSDMKDVYALMPEEERERLRRVLERYKEGAERCSKLYDGFIRSIFMKSLLEQQMLMEDAAIGSQAVMDDPELELLYREISDFRDTEIPKAIELISRLTRQLSNELSAKRQKNSHAGKLDFRGTIRKGMETGGSFYRLKFKKKHRRQRTLVLLCDVSGSMMQFSEFALRFIQSMAEVSASSRTFLFSEVTKEADKFSLQNMDVFRSYVKELGIMGKGTDLGSALELLLGQNPRVLNSNTTLIIVSDTKTVAKERAQALLREAVRASGSVVWLNPIPERKWPYIRSVVEMGAFCRMLPCSNLRELTMACRRIAQ